MKYALFLGCTIPARLPQYEASARVVLEQLGIELVDIPDFNCCGYPMRNFDEHSYMLSSARNIALAEERGLDILVLCKCCFGSLKKADYQLKNNSTIRDQVNEVLEGPAVSGTIEIKHLLTVLFHEIGVDVLREKVKRTFSGLNIATHYGCHALRPSDVVQFDDPVDPRLFDELVEVTGARSIEWSKRLDCCGAPLLGINDDLSMDIMQKKLSDGKVRGADYLCVSCPYCQLQFDTVQHMMISKRGGDGELPSVLYTQLLGLSLGIDAGALQLEKNEIEIGGITDYLK
jgi:heterodisulfide reductase subunit B